MDSNHQLKDFQSYALTYWSYLSKQHKKALAILKVYLNI